MRSFTNLLKIIKYNELEYTSFIIGRTLFLFLVIKESSEIIFGKEMAFFICCFHKYPDWLIIWVDHEEDLYHELVGNILHEYQSVIIFLNKG